MREMLCKTWNGLTRLRVTGPFILREAVIRTEGRDINLEQVAHNVMPPGLHLDYGPDFLTRRVDDIAPTLTSPLLCGLVNNIGEL